MNVADMKSTQRLRRPTSRFRRYAAAAGSLALVGTLSLSGLVSGGGIEDTEAAWSDTEYAQTEINSGWPTAFTSVVAGTARSADASINGTSNMTYDSRYRWNQQLDLGNLDTHTQSFPTGNGRKWTQDFQRRHRGAGEAFSGTRVELTNPDGSLDPGGNSLHNWNAVRTFENPTSTNRSAISARPCLVINETFTDSKAADARCGLGENFAAASNTTEAYGFSMAVTNLYISFLNAADITTGVKCSLDSAEADAPTGRVDVGLERGSGDPFLAYSYIVGDLLSVADRVRTVWAHKVTPNNNYLNLASGNISGRWEIGLGIGSTWARAMPIITEKAVTSSNQNYAISEVAIYVEVYDTSSRTNPNAKMYFVLSRSECGVSKVPGGPLPRQASVFPTNGLPGTNARVPFSGTPVYTPDYWNGGIRVSSLPSDQTSGRTGNRAMASESRAPATTVTSPLESATASDTTTSAPPNPSDEEADPSSTTTTGQVAVPSSRTVTNTQMPTTNASATSTPPTTRTTLTTTSAAPVIVVPGEPGDLAATARTEEAGTVEVDGDELVVVVKGDTVPTDARTAPAALDTWINDRRQPSGDWTTFTSTDPDESGWRWAAINQETGTIVYIR